MNDNERDLLSRYANAVSDLLSHVGWCSVIDPTWSLVTLSCGKCAACRVRNLQTQIETMADGDGTHVVGKAA